MIIIITIKNALCVCVMEKHYHSYRHAEKIHIKQDT